MKINIDKAVLLEALGIASTVAARKTTMPQLSNVLLRTDGKDKLLVAATDLGVTVSSELPCKVSSDGGITIGAKHLHDIVKSLPGSELALERGDNQYAEIRAGKVEYKVVGMADRDFPKLPNHREVQFAKVDAVTLRDMVAKTFFSISTDETRYHLNGVLFESDGKVGRMVSTDGHRLSKVERPLEGGPALQAGVIIPRKGLVEVRRVLEAADGKVDLGIHAGHLFVRRDALIMAVKLTDAALPPFEQVIPTEFKREVVVPRVALLEALQRSALVSSVTRFELSKNRLRLDAEDSDQGTAVEDIEVTLAGKDLRIGFTNHYLIDLVDAMDGAEVKISMGDDLDPMVVKPVGDTNYMGVVMPVRI